MKNITKVYKIKDSEINVTISYGLNKEQVLNHPMDFDSMNPHILYVFLSSEDMETHTDWLWENKENNPFVVVMLTKHDEKDFEKIESSVDLLYTSVKEKMDKNDN